MAANGAEGWKAPRRRGGTAGKGESVPAPAKAPAAAKGRAKSLPTVDPRAVAAIVAAEHGDPFAVLGPHEVASGIWEVRAMLPEARAAAVEADGGTVPMERRHAAAAAATRCAASPQRVRKSRATVSVA